MSSSTDLARPDAFAGIRMPELRPVEATHESARAQGYAVGWAQGRREAEASVRAQSEQLAAEAVASEARREAEHAAALAALHAAAAAARQALAETCRRVDEQAAGMALELTRALVGAAAADAAHVLDRVLGLLPQHAVVQVRLHPVVAAEAGSLGELGIAVVADPTLGLADAVALADDHVVDLRVDEAVTRLAEVLR
ncbi:FliH/SctL family protein [Nocardioides zeicaulis]|uniref:Flagellar assembly protein FliH/Type III secretion system HrpE domain-containing protein n=1 Tax=Nocardioides zeicaulis TaxID=1776857 RepID=A0ABV6E214_9ACTN